MTKGEQRNTTEVKFSVNFRNIFDELYVFS